MKKLLPLVAGLAGLGLIACGDDKASAPVAPIVKKTTGPAKEVASKAPAYVYSVNPTAKRDPFRSPMGDFASRPTANSSCNEPLCQYDLNQLTLVAVVTGDANPVAMVEDPRGQGYLVHRNSRVGKQGGKVTQILRDSISVTEVFIAPDGKSSPNTMNVALKPDTETNGGAKDLNSGMTYP